MYGQNDCRSCSNAIGLWKTAKKFPYTMRPEMTTQIIRRQPREASTLFFKIRSCTLRSDLKNKRKISRTCPILRSDRTVQDRIFKIRVLASLGLLFCNRCACNQEMNSQTMNMCVWLAHAQKVPCRGTQITLKKSCQKSLCKRCPVQLGNELSHAKNVCVIILGP